MGANRAIVLAAGRGARLGPELLGEGPKSMLRVAGRSILEWQVDALSRVGVKEILLIVGHGSVHVERHAAELSPVYGVDFQFRQNPDFLTTNTIVSMHIAGSWLEAPCYCLNGDVLFSPRILEGLAECPEPAALAIDVKRCGEEEVKVLVDRGRILAIGKHLEPAQCLGEFIGIARFLPEVGRCFRDSLRHCVEIEGLRTEYFERSLNRIVNTVNLSTVEFVDQPMIEIDTPHDLMIAIETVAPFLR